MDRKHRNGGAMNLVKKTGLTVGVFLALATFIFTDADSLTSFKIQFNSEYKTSGTDLDACITCHKGKPPKRNPYGADFKAARYAFELIELKDSDGDGFTNIAEIQAGTFPGDPESKPVAP
jgi:hypothetical protein